MPYLTKLSCYREDKFHSKLGHR